jgi:hypothetical protein
MIADMLQDRSPLLRVALVPFFGSAVQGHDSESCSGHKETEEKRSSTDYDCPSSTRGRQIKAHGTNRRRSRKHAFAVPTDRPPDPRNDLDDFFFRFPRNGGSNPVSRCDSRQNARRNSAEMHRMPCDWAADPRSDRSPLVMWDEIAPRLEARAGSPGTGKPDARKDVTHQV